MRHITPIMWELGVPNEPQRRDKRIGAAWSGVAEGVTLWSMTIKCCPVCTIGIVATPSTSVVNRGMSFSGIAVTPSPRSTSAPGSGFHGTTL